MIEETPSLWKEFVWPYYDSREECSVKEVLKVCGQHIKVLSFPNSRVPSTLVEMLQHCSNVQHLSLPSTKLDPEQLRNTVQYMRCLQTIELEVDWHTDIEQLILNTGQLMELTIIFDSGFFAELQYLFKYYVEIESRPLILMSLQHFMTMILDVW